MCCCCRYRHQSPVTVRVVMATAWRRKGSFPHLSLFLFRRNDFQCCFIKSIHRFETNVHRTSVKWSPSWSPLLTLSRISLYIILPTMAPCVVQLMESSDFTFVSGEVASIVFIGNRRMSRPLEGVRPLGLYITYYTVNDCDATDGWIIETLCQLSWDNFNACFRICDQYLLLWIKSYFWSVDCCPRSIEAIKSIAIRYLNTERGLSKAKRLADTLT